MNRHQLTSIAVAMACFFAVGVAATTLSSTLSSDPSEAVDLNYQYLPIESSDVSDFQQKIETKKPDASLPEDHEAQSGGRGVNGSGSGPENKQPSQPESHGANPSTGDLGEQGDQRGQESGGKQPVPGNGSQSIAGSGSGGSDGPSDSSAESEESESSSDGLLPLVVGLLLVGLLVALAYRYRDRLLALFSSDESAGEGRSTETHWEPSPPADANIVFEAWDAMMRRLEVEDTRARTTEECASAAANAGMDPDAVETLTRTFEEVRYGERPVTDDRRQRVSQVCQRLQLDPTEGGL